MEHVKVIPPQPGLRSFIIFGAVPKGCIAVEITDSRAEPHFRRGDFAIVDPNDRDPIDGDMSVIQYDDRQQVAVTIHRRIEVDPLDGSPPVPCDCWCAEWRMPFGDISGKVVDARTWRDGPFREPYFRNMIVGRVVGIYEPDFRVQIGEVT